MTATAIVGVAEGPKVNVRLLKGSNTLVRLKSTASITAAATVPIKVNQVVGDEAKIQLRPLPLGVAGESGKGKFWVAGRCCAVWRANGCWRGGA